MKRIWIVLLIASVAAQTYGQQVPAGPPVPKQTGEGVAEVESTVAPPMPLQVQAPTQRAVPFDRVMYVLDVSCSMSSQLADAIAVTDTFCSDGFKAAVVTFNGSHARWGGVSEPCRHPENVECGPRCLEPGWAWMPRHRTEMLQHLQSFNGSGGTNPTSALDYAFRNAPAGTLIVFISDGEFSHEDDAEDNPGPLSVIRTAQAWRRTQKLAPVQMLVWAVSEVDSQRESLMQLSNLGGGGLWRADTRKSGPW